jgi:hypothetical protein
VGVGAAGIVSGYIAFSGRACAGRLFIRWRMVEPVPVGFRFAPDVYFLAGYFFVGEVVE